MSRPILAVPIATLDEKFVANDVAFAASRPTATLVVDGAPLRAADGSIDRDAVRRVIARLLVISPELRQRLMPAPLGLFSPSWVPADPIDLSRKIFWHDRVEEWDQRNVDMLFARGPGSPARGEKSTNGILPGEPLWDVLVIELTSGDLAIALRVQHVIGDGMFGIVACSRLLAPEPNAPFPEPSSTDEGGPDAPRAPRNPIELMWAARRTIAATHPTAADEWRTFWRKPLKKRLKRIGGRNLQGIRNRAIRSQGLIEKIIKQRHTRILSLNVGESRKVSRYSGGSLNDLTVALTLIGLGALLPERTELATLVPVSLPSTRGAEARNHVSMVRAAVPNGTSLLDAIRIVHEQTARAVETGDSGMRGRTRDWLGYASYLPVFVRKQYFGPAEVRSFTLWPTAEPNDEIAVFSSTYASRLDIALSVRADLDLDVFSNAMIAAMENARAEIEAATASAAASPAAASPATASPEGEAS